MQLMLVRRGFSASDLQQVPSFYGTYIYTYLCMFFASIINFSYPEQYSAAICAVAPTFHSKESCTEVGDQVIPLNSWVSTVGPSG